MFKKTGRTFKGLQWKLIFIFVLLILAVMIIAGTFLLNSVLAFYHNDFRDKMETEFSGIMVQSLEIAMASEAPRDGIADVLEAFSTSRLGISDNRSYYVLDGKTAEYIAGSAEETSLGGYTPNIISAMAGKIGNEVSSKLDYMDYAYPLKKDGQVEYIVYIRDNKQEIYEVSQNFFGIILQAVLYGALIAMVLGVFMSRVITVPVRNLTIKAGKMAEGKFDTEIEVKSNDEIGVLTNTFNVMASKLKHTLDEVSGERDKVEVILKNMDDGIITFGLDGKVAHINPAACEMFGLDKRKSYSFDEFFEKTGAEITFEQAMDGSDENDIQIEANELTVNVHFAPYKKDNNRTEGVIAVFHDVTKQLKLENSRRAFVADVSHELRTPLTNIKSYSETLLEMDIDDAETRKSFLSVIDSEADRMTRLVKDLLALSQLDNSKTAFDFKPTDVQELITGIVKTMVMDAKKHKILLAYIPSGSGSEEIYVDKDRISQVIVNIISNAIKYTPEGGSVTVLSGQQEKYAYIKVTDTGIGIPEKDLPMIFERFYRVDKARSRQQGGTGLGLAIAREIVEAHKGQISIESIYGSGTTVTVRLPLENPEERELENG